jgi:glutamate racemase
MIGVFDSGYGGLSVFKGLEEAFPELDLLYLGDNARAPYGVRSEAVVYEYTRQAVDWLMKQGCSMVVLACNTASAQALPRLQDEFVSRYYPGRLVIGVIEPIARAAAEVGDRTPIGVVATKSTVASNSYPKALARTGRLVIQQACPLLVPLIEEGRVLGPITDLAIDGYVAAMRREGVGVLVLGCTHYYFLKHAFEAHFPGTPIVDASSVMPEYVKGVLAEHPELARNGTGVRRFATTDEKDAFAEFVLKNLDIRIEAERVNL